MDPDRWLRVEQLFQAAMPRPERERAAFLREACGGDDALRREVESLLRYAPPAEDLMRAPGLEVLAAVSTAREPSLLAGQSVGSYQIEARLGSGGMGDVYRARDTKLDRRVAIKVLPRAFSADTYRRARFEREARLLAALNHPNIGTIYGLERYEGIDALVLELFEGPTLAERLNTGPLPIPKALAMARQIAEALEAAHEKGIVHRDLKPSNIALTRDERVKVFDFGLAKAGVGPGTADHTDAPTLTTGATSDGMILGTLAYMSPEQARGQEVDPRTDIWAFGCVLLEMVAGRKAFEAGTASDTMAAVLDREPNWTALPAATPPALRRLLQRCLEKDAKRRLHHMADARIEIEDLLRAPAAAVVETPPIEQAPRAGPRRTRLWAAAAAVALVAIGAVAGRFVAGSRAGDARSQPTGTPARLMITLPSGHALERGRVPSVVLSPDGHLLAYAAAPDGGRTQLFLRPIDDLAARPIAATEGASAPCFSPDGRWLAFYADGLLKRVPVAGGVPLTIGEAPPLWSASWGEDDRIVFASTLPASGLWVVSANGGEPARLTAPEPGEAQHAYPQILPGSTHVLFSVRRGDAWHLASLAFETGEWRRLGDNRIVGEGARYLSTGHVVYTQGGGLVATPFDPATGDLDRAPVPLLERVEVSRFGGAAFAVADRAGTLAYVPPGAVAADRTLLRVERDGRTMPLIEARAAYETPAFSPDGRLMAVTIASDTGSDIWIIDLERGTRLRLTAGGTSAFPVWGPDGSRVAFQAVAPGPWNLFWREIAGSTTAAQPFVAGTPDAAASWPSSGASFLPGTLPTLSGANPQFPTSWSPDGATLAFHERRPSGDRDIWTVSTGAEPMPFLLTPFDEHSPHLSPDGAWLAYVSDESGREDVYVQPFPGPGPKWLVSTEGGTDPVWSKDGRELFYRSGDQMMAVRVSGAAQFSAGRPQRLFAIRVDRDRDGPSYDVAPDGGWFAMPGGGEDRAPGQIHVVLNWFSEVTTRTASGVVRQAPGAGTEQQALRRQPR
jgi:Tol biopolymer transport system component